MWMQSLPGLVIGRSSTDAAPEDALQLLRVVPVDGLHHGLGQPADQLRALARQLHERLHATMPQPRPVALLLISTQHPGSSVPSASTRIALTEKAALEGHQPALRPEGQ